MEHKQTIVTKYIWSGTLHTVHDTENLTFSADDRVENPRISTRTISGFSVDNQRIPHGHLEDSAWTISRFCAEQLADSVRNSADVTRSRDYHNPQVWNVDYTNIVVERFDSL